MTQQEIPEDLKRVPYTMRIAQLAAELAGAKTQLAGAEEAVSYWRDTEVEKLRKDLAAANARVTRIEGWLRGRNKKETADNIFFATKGAINTRSVWIAADEIWSARAKGEGTE